MELLTSSKTLGEMALLCYRTISGTDLSHLLQSTKNINAPTDEIISSRQYSSVYAQCTNCRQRKGGDILKRAFGAIYLTMCLKLTGKFSSFDSQKKGLLHDFNDGIAFPVSVL